MKKNTDKKASNELPKLDGSVSLDDIIANADDGTYGKPADEFEVDE